MASKEIDVDAGMPHPSVIAGEQCPFCNKKTLTLAESELEVPYFGKCFMFSMDCSSCGYHKADVEAAEDKPPVKYTIRIDSEDDMRIRVVKSSFALIKLPRIGSIEPGEVSNGYITNIEGILNRLKKQIEYLRDDAEDPADKKKAKNIVKKLQKIMWGQESITMTIEDKSGNSSIISEKAEKTRLKSSK